MNSVDVLTKKAKHSSPPNWSNLPVDLLTIVSNKIEDIVDFLRFGCVCKSWNLASKNSTLKSPQTPWLLLPYDSKTTNRSFMHPLFEAIYSFDIPEARDHAIIGSSNGWLVLIDKIFNLKIINPITRTQVDQYIPQLKYFRAITKVDHLQELSFIARSLRCYVHMSPKYPESLSDCVLAFSVDNYEHVLFCNIGDKSWNTISLSRNICSLAYHKGKIYVICEGTGLIGVSDAKSDSIVVKDAGIKHVCYSYFVRRENELLLLVDRTRDNGYDYNNGRIKYKNYEVFKLEDSDNCGDTRDSSDDNSSSGGTGHTSHSDSVGRYKKSDSASDSSDPYYDEGYADHRIGDSDEIDIEENDDIWLEYNKQSDYTIFFTSGVVSTIFSSDPPCFEGKSVCYPSRLPIVGYLDVIKLYDLDNETEEMVADLGDRRFCPYELNPIWLTPSLY